VAHQLRLAAAVALVATACGGAPKAAHVGLPALADMAAMSAEYRTWLDDGRTPSRVVDFVLERADGWKVVDVHDVTAYRAKPGDKLIFVDRGRTAMLVVVGEQPLATGGVRLVGAHIDTPSPRLSFAATDEKNQQLIKTHRYGGMRNHHWRHLPVAIVGRVAPAFSEEIDVELGLDDDFTLVFDDHASGLSLRVSSMPTADDDEAGYVATTIARELHRRYGLVPKDLLASELYVVPRHGAREVGLDRALIGAHGQDDRVNSYAAWRAIIDLDATPSRTAIAWLVDREEIGSSGTTGARSAFLEMVVAYLLRAQGQRATEAAMHKAFAASQALSCDTPAALNPNFQEVHEEMHAPILGNGPALFPFTGKRGKDGGGSAHAELIASVFASFERAEVPIQTGELGRVDEGGGGTIAKYLGERGIDFVDVGVSVISMHSPFELASKADIWAGYRGFKAWLGE
jgi:aspartyl aminopeptidase